MDSASLQSNGFLTLSMCLFNVFISVMTAGLQPLKGSRP
ncbi:hypothetical protein CZ787_17355 [Halomonas citrativorans]|uniref:Uncharacterized protein n=1 Tax=Halomonas citrativorans TaxID=2742612 RepID=A0A1R4I561_9GAMM|nr:hypothetical protein CZ787_17355 [Halomonas citrativorans]